MRGKMKKFRKNWKLHLGWLVAITLVVAFITLVRNHREIKRLKDEVADAEQTLKECQHSFEIWNSQIESGEIKVKSTMSDGTEVVYRWTLEKEKADDTWILK